MNTPNCEWTPNWDGFWATGCGNAFCFINDDGPTKNEMKFCPYCGRPLVKHTPIFEKADDE